MFVELDNKTLFTGTYEECKTYIVEHFTPRIILDNYKLIGIEEDGNKSLFYQ